MKINNHLLSIPPYISTSWKNIKTLHVGEDSKLIITLFDMSRVIIPDLGRSVLQLIFETHSKVLEAESLGNKQGSFQLPPLFPSHGQEDSSIAIGFPLKIGLNDGLESLGSSFQHNPLQANAPDLPKELLEKLNGVAKVLGFDQTSTPSLAEPNCNCVYCQVARAIRGDASEELVSVEDLKFRDWQVEQTAEKMYQVTHPLDATEKYAVYLGDPIGCTCGIKNCEHVRSVLNS